MVDQDGGSGGLAKPKNKRVTTASELSLAEHLAVLDEATELPPFGFNIAGLEQRLERRLGFGITQVRHVLVLPTLLFAAALHYRGSASLL